MLEIINDDCINVNVKTFYYKEESVYFKLKYRKKNFE